MSEAAAGPWSNLSNTAAALIALVCLLSPAAACHYEYHTPAVWTHASEHLQLVNLSVSPAFLHPGSPSMHS